MDHWTRLDTGDHTWDKTFIRSVLTWTMMKCHKQDAMKLIHLTLKYKINLGTSPIVSASLKTIHTKIEVGLSKSISFAFFSLKYRWLQAVYSRELIDTRNFGSHWVVHWAGLAGPSMGGPLMRSTHEHVLCGHLAAVLTRVAQLREH